METMHILLGFNAQNTKDRICTEIISNGFEVDCAICLTKPAISDYILRNQDCTTIILKEFLDDGSSYSAEELAQLNDLSEHNIIVLVQEKRKGTDFMRILYQAGITSAVFPDGRKGVVPEVIARLACEKRCRKEAREYYGIQKTLLDSGNLTYADFVDYYRYLVDESQGYNGTDRFLTIMRYLSPGQAADFIHKLPTEMLDVLTLCSEFYDVIDELRRLGAGSFPYKRPKKVKKGIANDSIAQKILHEFGSPEDFTITAPEKAESDCVSKVETKKEISVPPLLSGKKRNRGFGKRKDNPISVEQEIATISESLEEKVSFMDESAYGVNEEESTMQESTAHIEEMTPESVDLIADILKNISVKEFLSLIIEKKKERDCFDAAETFQQVNDSEKPDERADTSGKVSDTTDKEMAVEEPAAPVEPTARINITEEMRKVMQSKSAKEQEILEDPERDAFRMFQRFRGNY